MLSRDLIRLYNQSITSPTCHRRPSVQALNQRILATQRNHVRSHWCPLNRCFLNAELDPSTLSIDLWTSVSQVGPTSPLELLPVRAPKQAKCKECGIYPADYKGLCEGCLSYMDHTAVP